MYQYIFVTFFMRYLIHVFNHPRYSGDQFLEKNFRWDKSTFTTNLTKIIRNAPKTRTQVINQPRYERKIIKKNWPHEYHEIFYFMDFQTGINENFISIYKWAKIFIESDYPRFPLILNHWDLGVTQWYCVNFLFSHFGYRC